MVEARELVTICRQIGGMLEAGVDILRVTRVVRAQTSNPRLLEAFGEIEHSLRVGASVSEALERVPDVFSPFAVSLVQEGEAKRDIAGAFLRIADFLQQEEEAAPIFAQRPVGLGADGLSVAVGVPSSLPSELVQELVERCQTALLRTLSLCTVLLLALAGVWWSVEAGFLERRWQNVALCGITALFSAGAAFWLGRQRAKGSAERGSSVALGEQRAPVQPLPTPSGAVLPVRDPSLPSVGMIAASLPRQGEGTLSPNRKLPQIGPRNGELGIVEDAANGARSTSIPGTPLATPDDLATARHIARKKYGAMADAVDVMSVQPDIYEMDLAETLNADDMETGVERTNRVLPPLPESGSINGTKPARNEADFD